MFLQRNTLQHWKKNIKLYNLYALISHFLIFKCMLNNSYVHSAHIFSILFEYVYINTCYTYYTYYISNILKWMDKDKSGFGIAFCTHIISYGYGCNDGNNNKQLGNILENRIFEVQSMMIDMIYHSYECT